MTEMTVHDGDRELRFTGELIAQSSSHRPGKVRWAEFELYRTQAGQYVLTGVGRTMVAGESDEPWAQVSVEPDGVIERLTMVGDDGVRYLPHVARRLLTQASRNDVRVKSAYAVEMVS